MFCERAKAFLSQEDIPYEERAVDLDPRALEELAALGFMTTPVLKIGGTVIVGFDPAKITEALRRS